MAQNKVEQRNQLYYPSNFKVLFHATQTSGIHVYYVVNSEVDRIMRAPHCVCIGYNSCSNQLVFINIEEQPATNNIAQISGFGRIPAKKCDPKKWHHVLLNYGLFIGLLLLSVGICWPLGRTSFVSDHRERQGNDPLKIRMQLLAVHAGSTDHSWTDTIFRSSSLYMQAVLTTHELIQYQQLLAVHAVSTDHSWTYIYNRCNSSN